MKFSKSLIVFVFCGLLSGAVVAEVDVGVSFDKDGLTGFYLAIGDHYQVEQKTIAVVREKNIPDEDLPVVFFLARHAGVKPAVIIKLRLGGKSWMDIAWHYNLHADLFYVPLKNPGPPYGKAWGHFKKKKRDQWSTIRLSDEEVVAFVNLKFLSVHYGHSADEIATMRGKNKSFVTINTEVKKKKTESVKVRADKRESSDKSKSKGKGKKKK
jgi:hypothetical protein